MDSYMSYTCKVVLLKPSISKNKKSHGSYPRIFPDPQSDLEIHLQWGY